MWKEVPFFLFSLTNLELRRIQINLDLLGFFPITDLGQFAADLGELHRKRLAFSLGSCNVDQNTPVLLRLEGLDLPLPLHHQTYRHRLNPSGRKPTSDFLPQNR